MLRRAIRALPHAGDVVTLESNPLLSRLRVKDSDWRVIFKPDLRRWLITVLVIDRRDVVYERVPKTRRRQR